MTKMWLKLISISSKRLKLNEKQHSSQQFHGWSVVWNVKFWEVPQCSTRGSLSPISGTRTTVWESEVQINLRDVLLWQTCQVLSWRSSTTLQFMKLRGWWENWDPVLLRWENSATLESGQSHSHWDHLSCFIWILWVNQLIWKKIKHFKNLQIAVFYLRVTLDDGSKWLVHKGSNYGVSSQTVVTSAGHMSSAWKVNLFQKTDW